MKQIINIIFTLAVFVALTRGDGSAIYVAPDNVTDVTGALGDCFTGARASVRTFSSLLCVRETPDEVMQKFKDAGATVAEHKK